MLKSAFSSTRPAWITHNRSSCTKAPERTLKIVLRKTISQQTQQRSHTHTHTDTTHALTKRTTNTHRMIACEWICKVFDTVTKKKNTQSSWISISLLALRAATYNSEIIGWRLCWIRCMCFLGVLSRLLVIKYAKWRVHGGAGMNM